MESSNASPISTKPHQKALVCLYAQRDEQLYRELQKYLVLWQRQGRIYWADPAAVQQADLVLLLVSPSFFATTACHTAMVRAFEAQAERGIPVVPVLARASDWRESDCGHLKALPDNELPIAEWEYQERAYENICAGLARVLPDLPALGIAPAEGLRLFQTPKLPNGYVVRSKEFAAAKQLLLQRQSAQATAITTALRGAGGFGKTTLALALCHDSEIQAAFPDGILWVELGEQRRKPLDVLNSVLASLEPGQTQVMTLEEAKQRWRSALQNRAYLLVIDDVWEAEALLPLLEGGSSCSRLVTTRNDLLLPRDAARVLVDAMEPQEAIAVLCQGLPEETSQAYQPQLEALVTRLGCWPLLLTLANGMLTDLVAYDLSTSEALTTVAEAYQMRGVTAFHLDNAEERQQNVGKCMKVSLQYLEEKSPHPHYRAAERYQELAVFPEATDIPLATLQIYWKESTGLQPWETKDLCTRLHRLSLLLDCDLGAGTIRLHDVLRNYLIQRIGNQLPALHQRLLDAYQQHSHLIRWADLPQNEAYLWQSLVFHLCQAGKQEALQTTLTDLSYLTRKALYVSVSDLEGDLVLASAVLPTEAAVGPMPSFFASLHRGVVRISHLLLQAQTEAEMGGLLLSHLGGDAAFATQQFPLDRNLPHPFLTAWHPLPGESSALLRTLQGHTGRVNDCVMSPDGCYIVSASHDHTLKVWDAATGKERLSLRGHTRPVTSCAVSPDGRWIVSASDDRTLKVWDAATGKERLSLRGHRSRISGCAVSPDGRFIVSADGNLIIGSDHTLKVWDAATGEKRLSLTGHTHMINDCAMSPDGRFIVSASGDCTLRVWNAQTGEERLSLRGHTGPVFGCVVSPDGRFIVSASVDGTLKLWETTTGEERFSLTGHTRSVADCAVSPDGRFIVSASSDGTLKMWDAQAGEERLSLTGHTRNVTGCAVSPDGRFIVSASFDGTLKMWNAASGAERLSLRGHTHQVNGCAVSPDGRWIVSASFDDTLKLWDAQTGEERLTLTGHAGWVFGCAVSPDGRWIVSASSDGTLKVWNAQTGEERLSLRGHTGPVTSCTVSPDGSFIVSAAGAPLSSDYTLKVWDAATGEERLSLRGHRGRVSGCAVSPDGRWIVSASSDDTLKLWDTVTGAELHTFKGHLDEVRGCAFSPDGQWIVSASDDRTLKVWDAQTGQSILTFPVDGPLFGCAFHPDGKHLVAGGAQGLYFLRLVV